MAKRGRPLGTTKVSHQRDMEIWLWIEMWRLRKQLKTGKRQSVLATCKEICLHGGLSWSRGGDRQAIEEAFAGDQSPKRRGGWREGVFIWESIRNANTLRSRYVEVNGLVTRNRAVFEGWTNMVYDMVGLPRPYLPVRSPFGPRFAGGEFSVQHAAL
jgi:hypothetical protein